MHLGTSRIHSVPLFFAVWDRGLTWVSDPSTDHSTDLAVDPRAAASIAPSAPPLLGFEGIQLRGALDLDVDQHTLKEAFLERFPGARGEVEAATHHRFSLLRPTWIRFIRRSEGKIERTEWSEPTAASGSARDPDRDHPEPPAS